MKFCKLVVEQNMIHRTHEKKTKSKNMCPIYKNLQNVLQEHEGAIF